MIQNTNHFACIACVWSPFICYFCTFSVSAVKGPIHFHTLCQLAHTVSEVCLQSTHFQVFILTFSHQSYLCGVGSVHHFHQLVILNLAKFIIPSQLFRSTPSVNVCIVWHTVIHLCMVDSILDILCAWGYCFIAEQLQYLYTLSDFAVIVAME